jgi:hypothetical protein
MFLSCSFLKVGLIVTIVFASFISGLPLSRSGQIVISEWSSPTLYALLSVYMFNASDGWAVGVGGTVIRWNGIQWSNVTSPTVLNLNSVFFVDAQDGWAVGQNGTIIQWNGTVWNTVPGPTNADLNSVCMVNADDGWAVGQVVLNVVSGVQVWSGTIIHWNGSNWSNVTNGASNNLFSVAMVNSADGWAAGSGGTMIHWNGTAWNAFPIGDP